LKNESSEEDEEERADDKGSLGECPERTRALLEHALGDATEASKLDTADDVDERRLMLESQATEATGTSSGGVAVEPLPNAGVAAPAEPPQVLNVTKILKRNYVSHAEAKLVKQLVKVLEGMFHATNPVPGVRCFEMKSGNGISTIWMQVPHGRVPGGDTGMKQQQRRTKIIAHVMEITGAGVETTTRIIRTQRAMFTEAALRASIVSKHRLGEEATLQVMQSVNASWSGMRALKKIFNHFGIVLKQKSKWREWRPWSRRCVGPLRLSRQR
jgi:hypothetical protein